MQWKTEGIVLRGQRLDDDRLITLLTKEQGVVTAFANGANRPRSPLAPTTELLCYCSFGLFSRRDRQVVDHADTLRSFFGLRADVEKLALASYFAQLSAELAPRGESAELYLSLLLNTLHFVEGATKDFRQLKALFELRLLTLAGYMPPLVGCRQCSQYDVPRFWFFPADGTLLCAACAGESPPYGGVPLRPGTLAAMRHIIYAQAGKLFSFSLASEEGLTELEKVTERYLLHQVERSFPSLEFYKSLKSPGSRVSKTRKNRTFS